MITVKSFVKNGVQVIFISLFRSCEEISLTIKIVVVIILEVALTAAGSTTGLTTGFSREAEVIAETSRLLKRLSEHLVLANVVVGDRATRKLHRLLKMRFRDFRNRIIVDFHAGVRLCVPFAFSLNIDGDTFSNG